MQRMPYTYKRNTVQLTSVVYVRRVQCKSNEIPRSLIDVARLAFGLPWVTGSQGRRPDWLVGAICSRSKHPPDGTFQRLKLTGTVTGKTGY